MRGFRPRASPRSRAGVLRAGRARAHLPAAGPRRGTVSGEAFGTGTAAAADPAGGAEDLEGDIGRRSCIGYGNGSESPLKMGDWEWERAERSPRHCTWRRTLADGGYVGSGCGNFRGIDHDVLEFGNE